MIDWQGQTPRGHTQPRGAESRLGYVYVCFGLGGRGGSGSLENTASSGWCPAMT